MAKQLTEEKVLKKLGIENFAQLTKDKVIAMSSMLDKMEPEVAKKALEQFPEFSDTMREMLSEYNQILNDSLKTNRESVKTYYDTCSYIIETLKKQLENENLSMEEKNHIIEKMIEVAEMIGEKDSENKKFLYSMAITAGALVAVVGGTLAAAVGAISKNDPRDFFKC